MYLQLLEFVNAVLPLRVWPLKRFDCRKSYPLDQAGAIGNQIPRQVGITALTLPVNIQFIEPKFWPGSGRQIVSSVDLAIARSATDAA